MGSRRLSRIGCAAALIAAFPACTAVSPSRERREAATARSARLERLTIDRFERDRLKARARVDHAEVDLDRALVTGESIAIDVLSSDDGAREAEVTAARGHANLRARTIDLAGDVRVRDREGRTLSTDAMRYDTATDAIATEGAVTISGDNFRAEGARLSGHPQHGELSVDGPTTARIAPRAR